MCQPTPTDSSFRVVDTALTPRSRIGALARRLAGLVSDEVQHRLAARGITDLRPAHLRVFAAVYEGPVRVTQVARRLGATKQTVGPLADELVARGYLRRIADPHDARAKLLQLTGTGQELADTALDCADALDREFAEVVGADRLEACRATLWALLTSPALTPPSGPEASTRKPD